MTRLLVIVRYPLAVSLLVGVVFVLMANPTYAYYCSFVNITNDYPRHVNSGDAIRIATTITLNCKSGPSRYEGYVSIVDGRGRYLTGTRFFVSPVPFNQDVTAQATNWLVAPQLADNWTLASNVDLYLPISGGMFWLSPHSDASANRPIEIQVSSPVAFTNSSQSSSESPATQSSVTTTLSTTVSTTISLVTSVTKQVEVSSSISPRFIIPSQLYVDLVVWLAALLLITLAIALRLRAANEQRSRDHLHRAFIER